VVRGGDDGTGRLNGGKEVGAKYTVVMDDGVGLADTIKLFVDGVTKISVCAPFWKPSLLLYAGDLGEPDRSWPETSILLLSAWFQ